MIGSSRTVGGSNVLGGPSIRSVGTSALSSVLCGSGANYAAVQITLGNLQKCWVFWVDRRRDLGDLRFALCLADWIVLALSFSHSKCFHCKILTVTFFSLVSLEVFQRKKGILAKSIWERTPHKLKSCIELKCNRKNCVGPAMSQSYLVWPNFLSSFCARD
jgi:hypothetical protein